MVGNVFIYLFILRTHFTATWVFLLLRKQNGERIKDFIIYFHIWIIKVSQIGRISVKFYGCDYSKSSFFLSGIKPLYLHSYSKKRFFYYYSFEKLKFISDEVWNDDEFVEKQGENGSDGCVVSDSRGRRRVEDCRNKDNLSWLFFEPLNYLIATCLLSIQITGGFLRGKEPNPFAIGSILGLPSRSPPLLITC